MHIKQSHSLQGTKPVNNMAFPKQDDSSQKSIWVTTELQCLFPLSSEKCGLDRAISQSGFFGLRSIFLFVQILFPANPISRLTWFQVQSLPILHLTRFHHSVVRTVYERDRSSLPSVAVSLPLWSPWLSLSLCWIWLCLRITCLGFGWRASEINTINLTS